MQKDERKETIRLADEGDPRATLDLTRVFLVVTAGGNAGAEVELRPTAIFGRDESCDLVLDDPFLSGRHARLEVGSEGVLLEDLGSTNGTRVNGVRVERAHLGPGDRVEVGKTVLELRSRSEREIVFPGLETDLGGMVGRSPRMRLLFTLVRRIAPTDLSVLVQGETGTGKELLARALHDGSPRRHGPFVAVDAASLSAALAGSALFGHEKGAFTGADRLHRGAFERAHGGTLFLDEIGELPPEVQSQLLRVLETRRFSRVGGEKTITVDLRIVAATHRPLQREAEKGSFRRDLLYRINQANLVLPPLRERLEDLPLLVPHLAGLLGPTVNRRGDTPVFSDAAMRRLAEHDWPGNVRELRNVVAQALALSTGTTVERDDLPALASSSDAARSSGGAAASGDAPSSGGVPSSGSGPEGSAPASLEDVKRRMIRDALERHGGNKAAAARELGVAVSTFWDWVKRHDLG